MKLLLTHGYFLYDDLKEREIIKPYVPLGILYLSSHLRSKGYDVEIYDSTFGSKQELFQLIESMTPAAIGIYGNLMTRSNVIEVAACARANGWKVILGGPEPPNYAEQYLDAGAHVIVAGEAELTLEALLRNPFGPTAWANIPGLIFRTEDGLVVRTPPAPLIPNLDHQPWPDRESVEIERYLAVWRRHHGMGSVSVITARGCPYSCNWCSHAVYGKTHRRRSAQAVADEVEWIRHRYNPDMLWFADDVFTIHPGWLSEFAREIQKRSLRLPFECITRADRINESVAQTLSALGCFRVWIGSESGSQRILDAMQRGVTVDQVRNAIHLCKQHGIQIGMFLMWGYEGEELEDIRATIDHVKQCRPDVCFTTVSYPIKGTPYYDRVAARLVNIHDWRQSTDRDLRIRGRHSRRFYQHADELLKSELAKEPDPLRASAALRGLQETWCEVEA